MKIFTLSAYSAASALLLGLSKDASAQMIYQDLDPDFGIGPDFPVDLNDDGISEMLIHGHGWWTFTSDMVYSSRQIEFFNYAEIATSAGVLQMFEGDTVDADLDFGTADQFFFYGYNDDGWIDIDEGASWVNNNSYIGMRFDVSGEIHYGWLRVELHQDDIHDMPTLYVKELAWNATADAPAPINDHVGVALFPELSDVGETNTATDLQLHFQKADDESHISSYRVILYPGFPAPTLAEANALSADRYTELIPVGADITMNFTETTRDIDGNLLLPGTYYSAIILSVADGIAVTENDLSSHSNNMQFIYLEAPVPLDVYLQSTGYDDDITGLYGRFYLTDTAVASVRAYLSDSYFEADELLLLDPEYYIETIPDAVGTHYMWFTADKHIYTSDAPILFEDYVLSIVTVPNGITNSIPELGTDVAHFTYPNYDVMPTVSIVDSTGTGADIQLHYPMFINEDDLELYRIFIAKSDVDIEPAYAYTVPPSKRLDISPAGIDLDVNLSSITLDTDGNSIKYNQAYRVYVALKGDFYPDYYSLAAPSAEFILEEPVIESIFSQNNNAAPNIWVNDQLIHIAGTSNERHTLTLHNASGQEVFRTSFKGTEVAVEAPELPAGVYVVGVESEHGVHHQTIFLQGK